MDRKSSLNGLMEPWIRRGNRPEVNRRGAVHQGEPNAHGSHKAAGPEDPSKYRVLRSDQRVPRGRILAVQLRT
jgi:hypothetical protein